jgi:hypothetical protein
MGLFSSDEIVNSAPALDEMVLFVPTGAADADEESSIMGAAGAEEEVGGIWGLGACATP